MIYKNLNFLQFMVQ